MIHLLVCVAEKAPELHHRIRYGHIDHHFALLYYSGSEHEGITKISCEQFWEQICQLFGNDLENFLLGTQRNTRIGWRFAVWIL